MQTQVKKLSLVLSALTASTFVYASNDLPPSPLPCPAINTIQQTAAKVDFAEKYKDSYIVITSKTAFVENNVTWYVGVKNIVADSTDLAIAKGKDRIQNVSFRNKNFADDINHTAYICTYGPGEIVAIGGDIFANAAALFKR